MPRLLRLIIATVLGFAAGSAVNMTLVLVCGSVIPPPAGADLTTSGGLPASMHLMEARHFLFPCLAHSLGTLVGAYIAALLTPGGSRGPAFVVGTLFVLGGCAAAYMLPAPSRFDAVNLILAYGPPTLLGHWLATRSRHSVRPPAQGVNGNDQPMPELAR